MNPTNDPHDDEMRHLLAALRRAGEEQAPSFRRTWSAASAARRKVVLPTWRLAWAAAAAAVIVFVAVAIPSRRPSRTPVSIVPGQAASDDPLPTDFLLTTNSDDPIGRLAGEINTLLRP